MKMYLRKKGIFTLFLLIGFMGFIFFYILPYFISVPYMFAGEGLVINVKGMLHNKLFIQALKNTFIFLAFYLPFNLIIPLILALLLEKINALNNLKYVLPLLLPMAIPSASVAFFWKRFFAVNGFLNQFLSQFNISVIDWLNSNNALLSVIVIYLWKNIGFNIILYISSLSAIPKEYEEFAIVEGATDFQILKYIKLIMLSPTFFVAGLMSVINSFKSFREIYIITGAYPNSSIYMLQHYLNNLFSSLNYLKLSLASWIFSLIITVFLILVLFIFNKLRK